MSGISALSTGHDMEPGTTSLFTSRAEIDSGLRGILEDELRIDPKVVRALEPESGLFGSLPEIDSMAVATLITAIEDRFGFIVDDEDVDGEMLETYGGLLSFVEGKIAQG